MDLKIFKIKSNFKKEKLPVRPNLVWSIILFVALVLVLASFFLGTILFMQINKDLEISTEQIRGQVKMVKKEKIEEALKYFTEREEKSTEILSLPSPVVDPSL